MLICHLCRNQCDVFAERCSYAILQLRGARQHSLRYCNIAYEQHHSSFANSLKSIFTASLKVLVAVTVALVIVDVNWNGRISKRARTNSRNVHGVLLITPVLV